MTPKKINFREIRDKDGRELFHVQCINRKMYRGKSDKNTINFSTYIMSLTIRF
jgi:hypothetical protein